MIRFSTFLTLASAAVALGLAASAQAGGLSIEKNHTLRVALPASAGAVIVGNPDIADVNIVDSRTIYIVGKNFGSSAVTVTGRDGKPLFDSEIIVGTQRAGAVVVYKGLTPTTLVCSTVCTTADPTTNSAPVISGSSLSGASAPMAAIGPATP